MFDKKQVNIGATIKYNPHLLSAEELSAIFVARKKELKDILRIIQQTKPNEVPQHLLITGQRGMGKSTLLSRVALAIEEDKVLSKNWLALRFPEEQYTVATLTQFWTNVLDSLADSLPEDSKQQREIDTFLESLKETSNDNKVLDFLQQWGTKHQKRLLLLIDSTDLLLSNLSHSGKKKKADAGASQLWRLRKTLQNSPCFFWLGCSYQPVDADGLYHDTFLDFFYNIELRPLVLKEVKDCMRELANVFGIGRNLTGEKAVAEIEMIFKKYPSRLKTMHRLSGGNLRTTVMLYELISAGGENEVQADLKRLLDNISPLYKARMENLAEQPRKILAHLFEYWAPISLAKLSTVSGLEKSSISPQLLRLELEGLIEKTALPNTSRKGYQVSERFFNIWYLMRNAPRRLRLRFNYLIAFMRLWFDSEELISMARQQNRRICCGELSSLDDYEYSLVLAETLSEQDSIRCELESNAVKSIYEDFPDKINDISDYQEVEKAFKKAIELDPKDSVLWKNLGNLLQIHLNNYPESERAYKKAIKLDPKFSAPWNNLGNLLQDHLNNYPEAEKAYKKAIELDPKDSYPWNGLGRLLQYYLNNYPEAEKAYKKSIELQEEDSFAYANLARLLILQNKDPKEIKTLYRTAITKTKEPFLLLQAHLYLNNLDLASQALIELTKKAETGDTQEFFRLKEQCKECHQIGLATKLADLMQNSPYATFLQPFILAIKTVEGDDQILLSAPVEIADMAKDVIKEIKK